MSREQLAEEARRAARNAEHNLRWMDKHPDRYDRTKELDMRAYLYSMKRFAAIEMKNARRPGRAMLRSRLMSLLSSILTLWRYFRKAESGR